MIHFTKDGLSAVCGATLGRGIFISTATPSECPECTYLIIELISPVDADKARVKEEGDRRMTERCPKCGKETYLGLSVEERWCKAFTACGWKGSVGETIRPVVITEEALHAAKPPSLEPIIKISDPQSCATCRCFHKLRAVCLGRMAGDCRRYPKSLPTYSDGWCGEWRAKA